MSSLHPLLRYLRRLSGGAAGGDVEDAQLLHRFLTQRDESAFTAIVQRYGAMVWALCVCRLGETPEAEDAFQATFLVLVRKASSLRGAEPLGPWLYGVAYRTAMKLRGQRARRAARETTLPPQVAEERPEQVWSDLRPVIDEEVNRLPEKYRRPVVLCHLQGMSNEEAAQRLGCAKGTVFSRLSRARELLRRRLTKRGLSVSAGVLEDNTVARTMPPALLCASTIRTSLSFAAGTASPALSAPLAALVEGVLRSMFLSKVKFVAVVLLILGLIGSGAGFVVHRTGAEQPVPNRAPVPLPATDKAKAKEPGAKPKAKADKPAKTSEERTALLKARVALAEKAYHAEFEGLTRTKRIGNTLIQVTQNPEDVYIWSVRWLQAQRELSPKHEDQVAALEAHLQRMTELKKGIEALSRDLMLSIKVDEAEWYRLEAELWLTQAKAAK